MLQISKSQWETLGQSSFDERLVAILREHHPEQVKAMPFPDLMRAIHRQTARARVYGLNDERSVAQYVYTSWLMGEEFDRRIPSINQILRDRRMTSIQKSDALSHFSQLVFGALGGGGSKPEARAA
jgi:hypothetical protein